MSICVVYVSLQKLFKGSCHIGSDDKELLSLLNAKTEFRSSSFLGEVVKVSEVDS